MPGPCAEPFVDAAHEKEISTAKSKLKPKRAVAANRRGGKYSAIIFSSAAIRPQLVATFDAPVDPKFAGNRQVLQSSTLKSGLGEKHKSIGGRIGRNYLPARFMLLVIDNYDSFTYNLVQYLGEMGVDMQVHRNDQITLDQIEQLKPDRILISPGPCSPRESGLSNEVIRNFAGRVPT